MTREQHLQIIFWAIMASCSLVIAMLYIQLSGMNGNERATVQMMLTGTAHKPFQYRMLTYWIANFIANRFDLQASVEQIVLDQFGGGRLAAALYWINALALFAASSGTAALARALGYTQNVSMMTAVALQALLLVFFSSIGYSYVYDLPQLALFAWSLWAIYAERDNWFVVLFVLTTYNKETSLVLVILYTWWITRSDLRRAGWVFCINLVLYTFIRVPFVIYYWHNPGGIVEWHFFDHLVHMHITYHHALLILAGIVIHRNWKDKPLFLRGGIALSLGALLPLYYLWGVPGELRVFLEIAPVGLLLMLKPPKPGGVNYQRRKEHAAATNGNNNQKKYDQENIEYIA